MSHDPRRPVQEPQRERVHRLASLGGLVALAGLDRLPPDFPLGVLLEAANKVPHTSEHHLDALRERGASLLRKRSAEKRAWTVHRQYAGLHRVELSDVELEGLVRALGRRPPSDPSKLLSTFLQALGRPPQRGSGE